MPPTVREQVMSELDDLEDTLRADPGIDDRLRDKARQMRASRHFKKRLKKRLDDDFNEVMEHPPE